MKPIKPILFFAAIICTLTSVFAHQHDSLSAKHLTFVENKNQWDTPILFKADLNAGAIFAEQQQLTFVLLDAKQLADFHDAKMTPNKTHNGIIPAAAYRLRFVNSNQNTRVHGKMPRADYNNYYLGNDPNKWVHSVQKFHEIYYEELYDGIDLRFYEKEDFLKYEFIVRSGKNPAEIQLNYDGVQHLSLSRGNLLIRTAVAQVVELQPIAFQIVGDDTNFVDCHFQLKKNVVSFKLGDYDRNLPLVIDPVLIFSSFSGSTADNWGYTATFDVHGNLYSGGNVFNIGYPTTLGAYQVNYGGGSCDIAISKFDATGSTLHFSTYLGGSRTDIPHSLVVNENDELYVLGSTASADFPTTAGAYSNTFSGGSYYLLTNVLRYDYGSDIVIAKFNSSGTALLGSTYFGGSGNDGLNIATMLRKNYADEVRGEIIFDDNSNIYVVSSTNSADFPTTPSAFQPQQLINSQDGCIIKMNHNLTNLIWSSYLGGIANDAAYSIVLASDRSIYVCGGTNSTDLPTTNGSLFPTFNGGSADGFVAHINENGTQLLHCTYLGRSGYDQTYLVKNDRNDNPHLFGQTDASGTAWVENAGWYVNNGGQFITKLTPQLDSVIWSTAFGNGSAGPDISPTALLVDLCNNIYMSGWGSPTTNNGLGGTAGLPITADAFQTTTDNNDYYFICISDDASTLVYASYFGSPHAHEHVDGGTSRFDNKGRIYQAVCAGCGGYSDFPTTPGAWSETNGSTNCNIGVIKFDFNLPAVIADFNVPNTVCAPLNLPINNTSQSISSNTSYFWDFGDGTTSTLENPTHYYAQSGVYTIRLMVQDFGSCNFSDTTSRRVVVLANSNSTLDAVGICAGEFVQIGIAPSGDETITYQWSPTTGLDNPSISNPIASPSVSTTYELYVSNGICIDTLQQFVIVESLSANAGNDTTICEGKSIHFSPTIFGNGTHFYWATSPDFSTILNPDITSPMFSVTPSQSTTYYFKTTNSYCTYIDTIVVTVLPFSVDAPAPYTICYGDSVQLQLLVDTTQLLDYQWVIDETFLSPDTTARPWVQPLVNHIYNVMVTNGFGCSATASIIVNIKQLDAHVQITPARCHDGHDGAIALSPEGGTEPYFYEWSNGGNTAAMANLPADSYRVIITDALGCKTLDTFVITQPQPIEVDLLSSTSVLCNQDCNGTLVVAATGGTGAFTYRWLDQQTGAQASGLCAGNYGVTASDENGCSVLAYFNVFDETAAEVNFAIDSLLCAGDCNAALTIIADFGGESYTILWDDGRTENAIDSLCSGSYAATLTTQSGCRYRLFAHIPDAPPMRIANIFQKVPSCHGDHNGELRFDVYGGTAPYHFFINATACESTIYDLAQGDYQITIVDANQCRIDTLVTLSEPHALTMTATASTVPCVEACVGRIETRVDGGTPPYSYVWSNRNTLPYGESLCSGTYDITVFDRQQCQTSLSVTIVDSTLFPQQISAWSDADTLFAGSTTMLHATDLDGFLYSWYPPSGIASEHSPTTNVTPYQSTTYVVTVSDVYGCTQEDSLFIFVKEVFCEEPYLFVPNAFSPNQDGKNDVLFVHGEVIESLLFRVYNRWGELVFESQDARVGWDGTYKNEPCKPDVYDFYLEVGCIGGSRFFKKGNVTLLR